MKPIVKYQGGKSKELPIIKQYIGRENKNIAEPFCGGAAVSFYFERPSTLVDINHNIINLYQTVSNEKDFKELFKKVNELKNAEHDLLETTYYAARDYINLYRDVFDYDPVKAFYYIVLRQLCFSGMERYNSDGEFNVPFGHYKTFSCNLEQKHSNFLQTCKVVHGSFVDVDFEDSFIFLDPPYLDRLGYAKENDLLHTELLKFVQDLKNPWLLIHSDNRFYTENYSDYNIVSNDFTYGQRFGKDKNHSGANTQHLYISNLAISPQFYSGGKESLQEELLDLLVENNLDADREIVSKLTGKACEYFISAFNQINT